MAHSQVGDFDFQAFATNQCKLSFFKVVNVRPEARQHMYVPHVFTTRTNVAVIMCDVVYTNDDGTQVVVSESVAHQATRT